MQSQLDLALSHQVSIDESQLAKENDEIVELSIETPLNIQEMIIISTNSWSYQIWKIFIALLSVFSAMFYAYQGAFRLDAEYDQDIIE